MKTREQLIEWLLEGDISIQYQVYRDLLKEPDEDRYRERIAEEGWAKAILEKRRPDRHWGDRFYQPKWTSTHYTLLDLRGLEVMPLPEIKETVNMLLETVRGPEGEICEAQEEVRGDLCVNGMFLNYASFFGAAEADLKSIIDFIIKYRMQDGAFNCRITRSGAKHSSVHTTICVLEGIDEFLRQGYVYRHDELKKIAAEAGEFLLQHRLYKSHRTGEVISRQMTMLSYPCRWKYDVLRGLEYFARSGAKYDPRMDDALDLLIGKRRKDGTWPVQNRHPGQVHIEMEKTGRSSRMNTLRAMRVLDAMDYPGKGV